MLSNAYFLAKFRFDTAENEPAKNLQNFRKMHFKKCNFEKCIFEKCMVTDLAGTFVVRHVRTAVTQGRRAEVAQLFSQPAFQPACQPAARVGQAAVHWSANKV